MTLPSEERQAQTDAQEADALYRRVRSGQWERIDVEGWIASVRAADRESLAILRVQVATMDAQASELLDRATAAEAALREIAAETYTLQCQEEDCEPTEKRLKEWIRIALRYRFLARTALSSTPGAPTTKGDAP